MNKSLCPYPFIHSHVSATYERKLCCVANRSITELHKTTDEYWNSDYIKKTRLDMISGIPIPDCSFCYDHENNGVKSLRQTLNEQFPIQHLVDQTKEDGSLEVPPSFFDYRSTTCNLHCTTCDHNHSSKYAKISNKLLGKETIHKVDIAYENSLGEEIITGLRNKTVNTIYWAGGEPMIMKMHWDVIGEMEKLYDDAEYCSYIKSIKLYYNTNMTKLYWKGRLIPEILSKFDVTLWASIDGVEETFEYCRDGASWETVKNNWLIYKKYVPKTWVTSVLSAPVLMDIDRFLSFFEATDSTTDFFNHQYVPNAFLNLLDIRQYPSEIFNDIIDNAIARVEKSPLGGKEYTLSILRKYKAENQHIDSVGYSEIKKQIIQRDKFLISGLSFEQLLEQINPDAHRWYKSITVD